MSRFEHWSRRKRGLDEASESLPVSSPSPSRASWHDDDREAIPTTVVGEAHGEEVQDAEPASVVEEGSLDPDLPDPDTLPPDADFTSFLLPGVSPALKRRALRRMFSASQYNVRDGLNDYDQDFSQARKLSVEVAAQLRRWVNKPAEETTVADHNEHPGPSGDVADPASDSDTTPVARVSENRQESPRSAPNTSRPSDPASPEDGSV